jgi:hypothetical protein
MVVLFCFFVVAYRVGKQEVASYAEVPRNRGFSEQCSGACDALVERYVIILGAVVECVHNLVECFSEHVCAGGIAVASHCSGGVLWTM